MAAEVAAPGCVAPGSAAEVAAPACAAACMPLQLWPTAEGCKLPLPLLRAAVVAHVDAVVVAAAAAAAVVEAGSKLAEGTAELEGWAEPPLLVGCSLLRPAESLPVLVGARGAAGAATGSAAGACLRERMLERGEEEEGGGAHETHKPKPDPVTCIGKRGETMGKKWGYVGKLWGIEGTGDACAKA
eukprot:1145784-Pelagomonas_calceolata.AAC.2